MFQVWEETGINIGGSVDTEQFVKGLWGRGKSGLMMCLDDENHIGDGAILARISGNAVLEIQDWSVKGLASSCRQLVVLTDASATQAHRN